MNEKRYHYKITGIVQGVGFRYFTLYTARNIGISGWVRNKVDGSVEAVANGTPEQLEQFEIALRKGPRMSNVTAVEKSEIERDETYSSFSIQ